MKNLKEVILKPVGMLESDCTGNYLVRLINNQDLKTYCYIADGASKAYDLKRLKTYAIATKEGKIPRELFEYFTKGLYVVVDVKEIDLNQLTLISLNLLKIQGEAKRVIAKAEQLKDLIEAKAGDKYHQNKAGKLLIKGFKKSV